MLKRKSRLNPNQKLFCEHYAGGGEYFGNAVWSYILAYDIEIPLKRYGELSETQKSIYDSAKVDASRLLTKVNIQKKCNELVDFLIKDEIVDRELVKVIMQNDELSSKVSAIKEYNALKQRVTKTLNLGASDDLKEFLLKVNSVLDG